MEKVSALLGIEENFLFCDKKVVKLDSEDSDYYVSHRNLENSFFKLVDNLILEKYNYDELSNDEQEENVLKLSVFKNMVNLYNVYLKMIPMGFDESLVCVGETIDKKIQNGTAAKLFKNDKKCISEYGEYYVLDLERLENKVKRAFDPSEEVLNKLKNKKQANNMDKFKNLFLNANEGEDVKLAEDYKKFRFVKNFYSGDVPDQKNDLDKIKAVLMKRDKIDNVNKFKKFIDKIKTNFNEQNSKLGKDEKDKIEKDEKKLCLKLDFILSVIDCFCDTKIFSNIEGWLYSNCIENVWNSNKNHECDVKFNLIKDQINSLQQKNKNFAMQSPIILYSVLKSNISERYSLVDLKYMFGAASESAVEHKIKFMKAIADNENKIINIKTASEFMETVQFFVESISKNNLIN